MTTPPFDPLCISLPFGSTDEQVNTSRYHWSNRSRSDVPFVIIQRTVSGEGCFVWEGRPVPVPAGHAFVAAVPEESAYFYPADGKAPWRFSWLNFYGPLAVSLCRELRRQFGPVLPLSPRSPAGSAYAALVRRAVERRPADPHLTSASCYGFLMEWARELRRPREGDVVDAAVRICRSRFHEPLGVKELAQELGLSREHFTRLFADQTGMPPARFLRDLRADAARRMLAGGMVTIREAALRCGFPSPRVLTRALADRKPAPCPLPETAPRPARAPRPPASRRTPRQIPP